jgi:O-antigen/teichoic acid export membrane protein
MFKKITNIYKQNKSFLNESTYSILTNILKGIASLIISIILVRGLTQQEYGQYSFIISLMLTLVIFTLPSFSTSIIRSVSKKEGSLYLKAQKYSFIFSLITIPIFLIIGLYYIYTESTSFGILIFISGLYFPFIYGLNKWRPLLKGFREYNKIFIYEIIFLILKVLILLLITKYLNYNLLFLFIGLFTIESLLNITLFLKTKNKIKNHKINKELISYGFYLNKIYFLNILINHIDKLLIGFIINPTTLAIYSVITIVEKNILSLIKSAFDVLLPRFSQNNVSISSYYKNNKQTIYVLIILIIIGCFFYYFLIEPISNIIFGQNYETYYYLSKIFVISIFMFIPYLIMDKYLLAKKRKKEILYVNIIHFLLKIIITPISIIYFDLIGAIIAYNLISILRTTISILICINFKNFITINQNKSKKSLL